MMKTLKIAQKEAQKLAGENYFVGTLDECWEESKKYGWLGTIPVSRLDGAYLLHTDAAIWSKTDVVLVDDTDNYWYKLWKVFPEWKEVKGKYFSGEEYTEWLDEKTGIVSYSNPFKNEIRKRIFTAKRNPTPSR